MQKVILIEFNELSAALLARFMAKGALPNFKRFYDTSAVYTTTAGDAPLEPWIQWPSVHCEVPYAEHGVRNLGDGARIAQKAFGTILSEHGIRVGIFGMMNGNYDRPNGYHVPDPWDARDRVHPVELLSFFDFVSHNVKENTRNLRFGVGSSLRFGRFMLEHGLRASTALAVFGQLFAERLTPALRWRRAAVLDLLQYDVFHYLNRSQAVGFASFFSNSTAHLQHYFWRNMDPRGFDMPPEPEADPSLKNAVEFGYRSMDRILGRFLRDNPRHLLILCTGLSQEPWFDTTKCTYRPTSFDAFVQFAKITAPVLVLPVMAERFRLQCDDVEGARRVKAALDGLMFRGEQLMDTTLDGREIHMGCRVFDAGAAILDELVYAGTDVDRFGRLLYRITAMNGGRHNRYGSLWIRNGSHRLVAEPVPIEAIAPTILAHFDIEPPATMRHDPIAANIKRTEFARQ